MKRERMGEELTDVECGMGGPNTHLSGVPEGNNREKEDKQYFKRIKENFPKLIKTTNLSKLIIQNSLLDTA